MTENDKLKLKSVQRTRKTKMDIMEELYIRHLVLNAMPIESAHMESIRHIFGLLNVKNFPPLRNKVKELLLPRCLSDAKHFITDQIRNSECTVTLEFDFWSDIQSRSISACIVDIALPEPMTLVYSVTDESLERHETGHIVNLMTEVIDSVGPLNVVSTVSDECTKGHGGEAFSSGANKMSCTLHQLASSGFFWFVKREENIR